tara:strand:- start:624 stop:1769 length:1146 start_codon:yes stop_codon:yes gene_type:complete
MMDYIPDEIIDNILSNLHKPDKTLKLFNLTRIYKLRIVNKTFKRYIDNIKVSIYADEKYNVNEYENIFNRLAYSGLECNFKWLFNNNFHLSINNINNLIIHFRYDILKLICEYDNLQDILFNRFNLFTFKDEIDILSLSKSENPLIVSGMNFNKNNTNLNIIKLLLNPTIKSNPYIHQLPELFNTVIKYNNIVIIKYLVTHYYSYISHYSYRLINYMMQSNNNDDLYFYLVQNNKINITDQYLINCIRRKYNDLFIFSYEKINRNCDYRYLISKMYEINNIELFRYILKNNESIDFLYVVNNMLCQKNMFDYISLLLNEYFDKLDKKSNFIKLCLNNCIDKNIIKHLVDTGFKITIEDIRTCLDMDDIILVEYLSKKYNSI